ncbi:MAG TPA: arylsulfotransferase family protein [Rubrobacter sp.]|nr:arylsulfotransferase family protein [Rubrobacter sp.]
MSARHTRRAFLKTAGAGAVGAVLFNMLGCKPADWISTINSPRQKGSTQSFRSRPELHPPSVGVNVRARDTAPGYVFVAVKKGAGQSGPMILDNQGRLVWFSKDRYATDFKVQTYKGEPVLTWWQGGIVDGHGVGEYVIFDSSYREVRRVEAGGGLDGDLHEFSITPRDTALLTAYAKTKADLSPIGGPSDAPVWDGIAQELDLETGEVIFEWHSLDHVGVEESYRGVPDDPDEPLDYFHINSIDVDHDDYFLISAKGTSTVYKIDRTSGEVIWRLGGKRSDFKMGEGTRTISQHDARRQQDGTITIFDNGAPPKVREQSRGIVVDLDMYTMKATLMREYTHPEKILSTSQGNLQALPNGNVFVGWGSEPFVSEYTGDGTLLLDLEVLGETQSYRAFRLPWAGRPDEPPAVAAERGAKDRVKIYASWNGATEVDAWRVLAGSDSAKLEPVGSVPWEGFETAIVIRTDQPYVAVRAEDGSGRVLGTSEAIKPGN